ncbi:tetratricopeptide (TPR) repeat protein [Sphingobium sp. B1D7B]|uniref:tetratricopeptide repeat protein n=1 Tax=unclassified Sphingobium TaxID=2611147 RepID=UPI002224C5F1|nr:MULTISPECIES: tetratricopeptide repeat protein [unclassified Sphingobium]MCW2392003.1 tetratricopeptide (TPR) repeat protein [Sphingobium sp. B11D3A]MCW2403710.1 tetratricopeptide (TPR) repeat protein [Sphingobium sp. B1D7B]
MFQGQRPDPEQAVKAQSRGDWARAAELYEDLLAEQPDDPVLLGNHGQVLRKLGRDDEALVQYGRAIESPEAPAAVWFNYGNVLYDKSKWEKAQAAFEQALALEREDGPAVVPATIQLARCAVRQGEYEEARRLFSDVLRRDPNNFTAWLEAGNVCRHHGTLEEALDFYRRAAEAAPSRYGAHLSVARALEQVGREDEAVLAWLKALDCAGPDDHADIHHRMGLGRAERGEWHRAVKGFRHALTAASDFHAARIDLADALMQMGATEQAEPLFAQLEAVDLDEDDEIRFAGTLMKHNQYDRCDAVLRARIEKDPENWRGHFNLGKVLIEGMRTEEAEACFDRVDELAGDDAPDLRAMRGSIAGKRGDVDTARDIYTELGEEEGPESAFRGSAAMAALYSETMTAEETRDFHQRLFAPLAEGAREVASFANDRSTGAGAADAGKRSRRLRVGYVTGDMHGEHPVSLFMRPVLARHDRDAFEITVYSLSPLTDDMTRRARGHVDRWRDAASISNTRLAQMIEDDGIDVLIDLIGHTGRNRAPLFGRRAAPVQAMFLGYPSTTGIPNMDWLISDPVTSPSDHAHLYTERLEHVPGFVFCYAPEREFPFPDYGKTHLERPLTFGSFNNVSKLTPYTIRLWAKAIVATPGSRLVLKGPSFLDSVAVNRFGDLFVDAGVAADRLEFRGPSSLDEMMAEYADIDIALDCFPYNGGTTSCQALWMGTPVITLAGESFVQRMGAGLMSAIGRPEWVAQDEEAFVEIAVRLASDRAALLEEKRSLRTRFAASPAGDIDRYTRELEDAYRRMWTDFAAGGA